MSEVGVPLPDGYQPQAGDKLRFISWGRTRWFIADGRVERSEEDDSLTVWGHDSDGSEDHWYLPDEQFRLVGGPTFERLKASAVYLQKADELADELASVPEGCTMRPVPDELHEWLMDNSGEWRGWGAVGGDAAALVAYQAANGEPVGYTPKPGDRVQLSDGWFDIWAIGQDPDGEKVMIGTSPYAAAWVNTRNDVEYLGDAETKPPWHADPSLIWMPESDNT